METDAGAWTTTNGGFNNTELCWYSEPNYLDNAAFSAYRGWGECYLFQDSRVINPVYSRITFKS